jgi:hypothetical protein
VLDPRISYEGLKGDCNDDWGMLEHLNSSKLKLKNHYHAHYAHLVPARLERSDSLNTPSSSGSPQKVDFTSRYRKTPRPFLDELEEYFKLPQEDFASCDPIQWWAGRRTQFPNLSRMARDILSIPGLF